MTSWQYTSFSRTVRISQAFGRFCDAVSMARAELRKVPGVSQGFRGFVRLAAEARWPTRRCADEHLYVMELRLFYSLDFIFEPRESCSDVGHWTYYPGNVEY